MGPTGGWVAFVNALGGSSVDDDDDEGVELLVGVALTKDFVGEVIIEVELVELVVEVFIVLEDGFGDCSGTGFRYGS